MNNYLIKGTSLSLTNKKIEQIIKDNKFTDAIINTYDLDEDSITSLIEDADTISFLTPNKVIIGKNFSNNALLKEKDVITLNKYLDNPNDSVILIFTATSLDMRKKALKDLINKLTVIDINDNPKSIIKDIFKDYNIEYRVINLLEDYYSDDLERLISECQKLKLAFLNTKKITYKEALDLLVKPLNKQDSLAFDLVREIALKDKRKAINIYTELLNYNIESYALMGLLESQYRLLYQVKVLLKKNISNKEIADTLEVHPFRVKKALELTRLYTLKELRTIIKNISNIDYEMKSGQVEKDLVLDLFILNID